MDCIKCGNVSNLIGSDSLRETVRRWRLCPKCGYRYFTYEIPEQFLQNASEYVESVKGG